MKAAALKLYKKHCGLFVDLDRSYLATTPDGVLDDGGIIKVKYSRAKSIGEAEKTLKHFFLKDRKLDTSTNLYIQIISDHHISGKRYCELLVLCSKELHIERIYPDKDFWEKTIQPAIEKYRAGEPQAKRVRRDAIIP